MNGIKFSTKCVFATKDSSRIALHILTKMQSIMAKGRKVSMQPMSRENLFSMRPDGLVLKKYIVARVIPRNRRSCNRTVARRQM